MYSATLDEAYERLRGTGPEWGESRLSNHGPMAVEVLVRRGAASVVHSWVDDYLVRLDELPAAREPITDDTWPGALGDGRRIGDWSAYLERQVAEQPWQQVLQTWWPRLLPEIVAGATHGVIRVGHAVRALLAGDQSEPAVVELAHGLAFWAARAQSVPVQAAPDGELDPAAALDMVPRIGDQSGSLEHRFGQLVRTPGWSRSIGALRPATEPSDVPGRLADLVDAATVHYLGHGQASPVLLVHAATAPNAVLHTLPALPHRMWAAGLTAVWAASAAIVSTFSPAEPQPISVGTYTADDLLERAVAHGDEHVIKFADTAAEVYDRTDDQRALAAGLHAADLIGR
ncbi:MAG: hypothetical protein ACRDQ5_16025 [Sciscionella sp.]